MNTITKVQRKDKEIVLTHEKSYPLMDHPHKTLIPMTVDEAHALIFKLRKAIRKV